MHDAEAGRGSLLYRSATDRPTRPGRQGARRVGRTRHSREQTKTLEEHPPPPSLARPSLARETRRVGRTRPTRDNPVAGSRKPCVRFRHPESSFSLGCLGLLRT